MKYIPTLLNIVVCGVLALMLASTGLPIVAAQAATPTPTAQTAEDSQLVCDPSRTIQVSGTASVKIAPDRALVQLGVQSNAGSVRAVQVANTDLMRRVIRALEAAGVASKDIATDHYVVQPVYGDYNELNIKGYRINSVVAVTVREVGKTSMLIASALEAGANQVVNVEFYTSELRKYRDQARDMAVTAAKEKAQALAQAAGAETGCVTRIGENTWSYYNGGWYGRDQNLWTQNAVQNAGPPTGGTSGSGAQDDGPVSLGQISVEASVDVTFALK
jgi:uncharacterized protein YggE